MKLTSLLQQVCGNFSCVVQATYILSRHLTRSKFSVSLHEHDTDLKIVVYGKRLTSDTLFAIKTKSLTVKCITYRIDSKYRKLRIDTPCLTTETWRLMLNDFVLI